MPQIITLFARSFCFLWVLDPIMPGGHREEQPVPSAGPMPGIMKACWITSWVNEWFQDAIRMQTSLLIYSVVSTHLLIEIPALCHISIGSPSETRAQSPPAKRNLEVSPQHKRWDLVFSFQLITVHNYSIAPSVVSSHTSVPTHNYGIKILRHVNTIFCSSYLRGLWCIKKHHLA